MTADGDVRVKMGNGDWEMGKSSRFGNDARITPFPLSHSRAIYSARAASRA